MYKLIDFAVRLLEKENYTNPDLLPSQNGDLNPTQNEEINPDVNTDLNSLVHPEMHPTQNPKWKREQWEVFKTTILYESMTDRQREKCKNYLKSL